MDPGTEDGGTPRCGIVVLARSDPRLLQVTLRAIGELARAPDCVAVVVPPGRDHVFAEAVQAAALAIQTVRNRIDRPALDQGFAAIAGEVDVVLLVPEGVILAPDYLDVLAGKAARWADLVGEIDVVSGAIKLPVDAPLPDLADLRRASEVAVLPSLRRLLRARSAMASMLWVRVAAAGGLKFAHLPEFCDFIALALFLDRLRPRGRTRLLFTGGARHIRLMPERRTSFEVGYALFGRLGEVASYDEQRDLAQARASYLDERLEMVRLLGEQALQFAVSPTSKRQVATFLQGLWAARRAARLRRQKLRREIRDLS